jgi:hypothetical protein
MKKNCDTLIIGSTFAGIGLACSNINNSLIIERTASPGKEYLNSFNPGNNWETMPTSPEGKILRKELENRNILANGNIHISALAPVICGFIRKKQLNILFWTEITQIEKSGNGFEIEIFNASGLQRIYAGSIIDTNPENNYLSGNTTIMSKSINAILHCEKQVPSLKMDSGQITDGRFPSEKFFSLPAGINDSWPNARRQLFDAWEKRPDDIKEWLIAATASEFAYVSAKGPFRIGRNWCHLPSSAYSNPLEAFEAGIKFSKEEQHEIG